MKFREILASQMVSTTYAKTPYPPGGGGTQKAKAAERKILRDRRPGPNIIGPEPVGPEYVGLNANLWVLLVRRLRLSEASLRGDSLGQPRFPPGAF